MDTPGTPQVIRLPVLLGTADGGGPLEIDLLKCSGVLVAGLPGSGKSNAMLNILLQLAVLPPEACRLALIDAKAVDFCSFDSLPNLAAPLACSPAEAAALLDALIVELDDRFQRLQKSGKRNIHEYCGIGQMMPPVIVAIDEASHLIALSAKVESKLVRLASLGRAAGITIVIASQRAAVDSLPARLTSCFGTRLAFRSSAGSSVAILGRRGAESLRVGECILSSPELAELVHCRCPLIQPEQIESTLHLARERSPKNTLPLFAVEPCGANTREHPPHRRLSTININYNRYAIWRAPVAIASAFGHGLWRIADLILATASWGSAAVSAYLRSQTRKLDRQGRASRRRRRPRRTF